MRKNHPAKIWIKGPFTNHAKRCAASGGPLRPTDTRHLRCPRVAIPRSSATACRHRSTPDAARTRTPIYRKTGAKSSATPRCLSTDCHLLLRSRATLRRSLMLTRRISVRPPRTRLYGSTALRYLRAPRRVGRPVFDLHSRGRCERIGLRSFAFLSPSPQIIAREALVELRRYTQI